VCAWVELRRSYAPERYVPHPSASPVSHPVTHQVTDLVEHELETAATEVERMTAGKPARSERLVARQQAQAKYSRFEAEVRQHRLLDCCAYWWSPNAACCTVHVAALPPGGASKCLLEPH
jgi:hypothetical protein